MRLAGGIALVLLFAACASQQRQHYEFPSVPIERSDAGPEYLPPPPPEPPSQEGCPEGATDCGGMP